MSLEDDRAELAKIRRQIDELLDTGQAVNVTGSHGVTLPTIPELQRREQFLRRRILRSRGMSGRVY